METIRTSLIGTAGTVATFTLQEWNAVVGIIVGLLTAAYLVQKIFIAQCKFLKSRDD